MRSIQGVRNAAVGSPVPHERPLIGGVTHGRRPRGRTRAVNQRGLQLTPGYFDTYADSDAGAGRAFTDDGRPARSLSRSVNAGPSRAEFFVPRTRSDTISTRPHLIVGVVADTVNPPAARSVPVGPLTIEEMMYCRPRKSWVRAVLTLVHTWFQPRLDRHFQRRLKA